MVFLNEGLQTGIHELQLRFSWTKIHVQYHLACVKVNMHCIEHFNIDFVLYFNAHLRQWLLLLWILILALLRDSRLHMSSAFHGYSSVYNFWYIGIALYPFLSWLIICDNAHVFIGMKVAVFLLLAALYLVLLSLAGISSWVKVYYAEF